MYLVRNVLAAIGLVSLIGIGSAAVYAKVHFSGFHPRAISVYLSMAQVLMETGNPAEATVWKARVANGLTFEDVEQSIQSLAHEYNIRGVGMLPLGDQVAAMQGAPWRRLNVYLYCNPLVAARMVEFSEAFAAYLPCRIALLEDEQGDLWLYSINMDLLTEGGRPLPNGLRVAAEEVRDVVKAIMDRAANGEF